MAHNLKNILLTSFICFTPYTLSQAKTIHCIDDPGNIGGNKLVFTDKNARNMPEFSFNSANTNIFSTKNGINLRVTAEPVFPRPGDMLSVRAAWDQEFAQEHSPDTVNPNWDLLSGYKRHIATFKLPDLNLMPRKFPLNLQVKTLWNFYTSDHPEGQWDGIVITTDIPLQCEVKSVPSLM